MGGTQQCPDCDRIDLERTIFWFHNIGNGKCNVCHGRGYTPLDGAISDFVSERPLPCWNCDETGKCPTCRGKGIVNENENLSEIDVPDFESEDNDDSGSTEECEEEEVDDIDDVEIEDGYCHSGEVNRSKLNSDNGSDKWSTERFWNVEWFNGDVFTPAVLLLLFLAALISAGIVWNIHIKRVPPQAVRTGPENTIVVSRRQTVKHRRSKQPRATATPTRPDARLMPSHPIDRQTVRVPGGKAENHGIGPQQALDIQPPMPLSDLSDQGGSVRGDTLNNSESSSVRAHDHSAKNAVTPAQPLILWAIHKHIVGGCSGQLQLWEDELKFVGDHQLRLKKSEISSIDGPGFVDKDGRKWHFKAEGKTDAELHQLLLQWKEDLH